MLSLVVTSSATSSTSTPALPEHVSAQQPRALLGANYIGYNNFNSAPLVGLRSVVVAVRWHRTERRRRHPRRATQRLSGTCRRPPTRRAERSCPTRRSRSRSTARPMLMPCATRCPRARQGSSKLRRPIRSTPWPPARALSRTVRRPQCAGSQTTCYVSSATAQPEFIILPLPIGSSSTPSR